MSTQLVNVVLSVKGRLTWCLEYARMVFGAPVVERTAWEAWEATKFKHLDRNFPDAAVPVWFEYWATLNGVYKNWGHVVVWTPGVGFYSSPHQKGTDYAILKSIEEVERLYKCKFVGWSEDISSVRVVEEGDDMQKIYDDGFWRPIVFREFKVAHGKDITEQDFQYWVGRDVAEFLDQVINNPLVDQQIDYATWGKTAKNDKWDQQIYDLRKEVNRLEAGEEFEPVKEQLFKKKG